MRANASSHSWMICMCCGTQHACLICMQLFNKNWRHAGKQIHQGKTKVWNQGGVVPTGVERFEVGARRIDLDAIVLRENSDIPTEQQGLKILGRLVGHHDFVQDQLSKLAEKHSGLLDRIILVEAFQSAWLLLVFCAAARANFFLRSVTPVETSTFATRHDDQLWSCFCTLLEPQRTCQSRRGWEQRCRCGSEDWASAAWRG